MSDGQTTSVTKTNDVDESIRKNNYKLTADKIKQILSEVRNTPSKSYRRWVWELMQNAKDVPNKFGRVSVQIALKGDYLIFKHNGNPFTVNNLTGLIQQVSSKASNSSDQQVTGKFGTGFISTHLLSDIIEVAGVVERPGNQFRKFELKLDRSGKTSEELLPKIEEATEHIRRLDDDSLFPIIPDYDKNRKEDDYHTAFTYYLSSEEKKKAAKTGLEDLQNTLPLTMVNVNKIRRVEVIDEEENTETRYDCIHPTSSNQVEEIVVKAMWDAPFEKRSFLVYKTDQVTLTIEVNDFEELKLINHFGEQPNLYRDFPLIGSEKFHFPFVLNGLHFFPSQDRDSILLNSQESEEAKENREIMESAQQAAVKFTAVLIEKKARNLFVPAYTRIPDASLEGPAKEWYENLQRKWRESLLDLLLVETASEGKISTLRNTFIPYFGAKDETKLQFHDLVKPFLGSGNIPRKDILLDWIRSVGPKDEIETWGEVVLFYDLEQLLEAIQEKKEIKDLEIESEDDLDDEAMESKAFEWLNEVFGFSYAEKEGNLLESLSVVPNQYGSFRSLNDLFEEDDKDPIPDFFLDVLKDLGEDWRSDMINRKIAFEGLNRDKRGMSDVSESINGFLKNGIKNKSGNFYKEFLDFPEAESILIQLLKVTDDNSTLEAFRHKLFKMTKPILQFEDDLVKIPGSGKFNFTPAIKLMIELINQKIEACKDIKTLAKKLNKTEEDTIIWLDKYLRLLEGNSDYKHFLEEANIIPNRLHNLCAFEDVHAFGTENEPLDEELINILKKLNPQKDWWPDLIADGIGVKIGKPLIMGELCPAVWEEVNKIRGEKSYEANRNVLLDLIEWGKTHENIVGRYLDGFEEFADRTFFILMIESSDYGKQVMKIFKDEKQIKEIAELVETGVDFNQLKEIAEIAKTIGSMDKILAKAKELLEEKKDFEYLKSIGEAIEHVFKRALEQSMQGSPFQYRIERIGVGAKDFVIHNLSNKKQFFIELKSHAFGRRAPIKMAISQAELCLNQPDQFALCVIERSPNQGNKSVEHIKSELKWVQKVPEVIKAPYDLYSSFFQQASSFENAKLEVSHQEEMKVAIQITYIESNYKGFNALIEQIINQLR